MVDVPDKSADPHDLAIEIHQGAADVAVVELRINLYSATAVSPDSTDDSFAQVHPFG